MRRLVLMFAMFSASCSPVAPENAEAQAQPNIEACVTAATTHDALWQCKGLVMSPCMETPDGQSTYGMMECQRTESDQWQAMLDAHMARLSADDPSRSARLAEANAAWSAWREAECIYQASEAEGGTLAGVLANGCHADLTADRVIALTWAERSVAAAEQ